MPRLLDIHPPRRLLALAASVVGLWLPQSGRAVDLVGSYDLALQADPSLRAARAALVAGREKSVQGLSLMKPQISFTAGVSALHESSSSPTLPPPLNDAFKSDSTGRAHQVALQLMKPLYNVQARATAEQMREQTALAEISFSHTQQELIQRVGEAYFGVLLAEESLRVVRAEKAAVQLQRDRAQTRFEVGRGKVTEVQEAQARLDSVGTREVSAESTLALRQAQYQELTGAPARGLAPLRGGFAAVPPQPDSLPAWQATGAEQNLRVQFKQRELSIAGYEIEKTRLSARPTVDLVASVSDKRQTSGASSVLAPDGSRVATIGVQLNVPLYTGGSLESRQRESLAKRTQAEEELAATKREMRLSVQDGYLAVKTGVARIASLSQQLTSARTALEATTLGRDVGTRTELDVLDAQQRVFGAELDLAQARTDYLLGRLKLAAAAGALQFGELQALNQYLVR